MTVEKRLSALRRAMEAAGMDGYFITCSDPHCGEYLPDAWKTVAWFSGFTGENATLVLTREETALWVDGRFFVQADKETAGTSIQVMKMGNPGVPTREDWLAARLKESQVCGFDGEIRMVVGVGLDVRVTGVSVVEHSETPNVGTRVTDDPNVLAGFAGLSAPVTVNEGENRFDAVAGATRTARGMAEGVNAALSAAAAYLQ